MAQVAAKHTHISLATETQQHHQQHQHQHQQQQQQQLSSRAAAAKAAAAEQHSRALHEHHNAMAAMDGRGLRKQGSWAGDGVQERRAVGLSPCRAFEVHVHQQGPINPLPCPPSLHCLQSAAYQQLIALAKAPQVLQPPLAFGAHVAAGVN